MPHVIHLTADHWATQVRAAQGRTVPATDIPWMRAREVCMHAVDLGVDIRFTNLPTDFLQALSEGVLAKRGEVPLVEGPLDQRVAWLTGRPHDLTGVALLSPWL
jgi:maleylpyruvate isomerase